MSAIINVLPQLYKLWMAQLDRRLLPDDAAAQEAIEKVLAFVGHRSEQTVDVAAVIGAIGAFQLAAGAKKINGVLTAELAAMIKNRLLHFDECSGTTTNVALHREFSATDDKAFWVRYYVDTDSFASLAGPSRVRQLLAEAWDLWLDATQYLLVHELDAPGDGVVTVRAGAVAEGVGLAPVLGPGNFNLPGAEVILDSAAGISDDAFRAIACHQFGHIIGIGHISRVGNLMSTYALDSVTSLTEADIEAARLIYGGGGTAAVLERLTGFVSQIEGDTAFVTLTSEHGDVLHGEYPAAALAEKGIRERRRFKCETVEMNGNVDVRLEAIRDVPLSEEEERAIDRRIDDLVADDELDADI